MFNEAQSVRAIETKQVETVLLFSAASTHVLNSGDMIRGQHEGSRYRIVNI